MAIQVSYTDPTTSITLSACYVKIQSIDLSFGDTNVAKVRCAFYKDKAARDSGDYSPIDLKPFFIKDSDTALDVANSTDVRNAVYTWLMANEDIFSGSTEV
jgi:hypothetical protein